MANRVIEQKKLKMKRMRRAWAKKFSLKNTGPVRYPGFKNEQGEWVEMDLRSRSKAARVEDLDSQLNAYLRKKFRFKETDPESIYARHRGLHTDLTRDGEIILARMVQSRGGAGTLQGEEKFVRKVEVRTPTRELSLYMSAHTAFFIDMRIKPTGTWFFKSIDYMDRHKAHQAFLNDRIAWEEITEPTNSADKK